MGSSMLSKEDSLKALPPMLLIVFGRTTDFNDLHSEKAYASIISKPMGSSMLSKEEEPKAPHPMLLIVFGRTTDNKPGSSNAFAPILSTIYVFPPSDTVEGMVTFLGTFPVQPATSTELSPITLYFSP